MKRGDLIILAAVLLMAGCLDHPRLEGVKSRAGSVKDKFVDHTKDDIVLGKVAGRLADTTTTSSTTTSMPDTQESSTSTSTTLAPDPDASTTTVFPCNYECCVELDEEKKLCPDGRDCVNHECGGLACPHDCCEENKTIYNPKNCRYGIPCVNTTCVKQDCPHECCPGATYNRILCDANHTCIRNKCYPKDSDYDGVLDIIEHRIGTNWTLNDTDFDNLADGEEHYRLPTNPLRNDTDYDDIRDDRDPNPTVADYPSWEIDFDQVDVQLVEDVHGELDRYFSINWTAGFNDTIEKNTTGRLYPYPNTTKVLLKYGFAAWMRNTGVFDLTNITVGYNVTYHCTNQANSSGYITSDHISLPDLKRDARIYKRYNASIIVGIQNETLWRPYVECPKWSLRHNVTYNNTIYIKQFP